MESRTIRFRPTVIIPDVVAAKKGLSLAAKRVYGFLSYCQRDDASSCLAMDYIAAQCDMSRQAVSRAVGQLVKNKLLTIKQHPRQSTIFSIRRLSPKKFFLFLNSIDSGYCQSRVFILNYLKFRQGEKNNAWPHIKTICHDLGLARSTVIRTLAELEKEGLIQVDHAHGGLKQGNKYALTGQGRAALYVSNRDPKSESGVSKCNTINNTSLEIKENNPQNSFDSDLSNSDRTEKRLLLTHEGIAFPVADSLAADHSRDEIENAILNAYGQQQLGRQKGKSINIPAYVIGTLNAARRESHTVKLNSYMQHRKIQHEQTKQRRSLKQQLNADQIIAKKRQILSPGVLRALGISEEKIESTQRRLEVA